MPKNIDSMIGDLVSTLTDPIIVYPGGWGDSLPEWLKNAIVMERLVENMKETRGERPTGTDAEACAYLHTASLSVPMDGDWSQIYLYVAGKTYRHSHKSELPDDIRVDSLTDNQARELKRLKGWLYQKRIQVTMDKEQTRRHVQQEEETIKKKEEQPALFRL